MSENAKTCAILSYLGIGVLWFFVDSQLRENEFAKYHAKQGIILFGLILVNSILWIPFITFLITIGIIVLILIGMSTAYETRKEPLPVIGKLADKIIL